MSKNTKGNVVPLINQVPRHEDVESRQSYTSVLDGDGVAQSV
jgi:hypothetical protein